MRGVFMYHCCRASLCTASLMVSVFVVLYLFNQLAVIQEVRLAAPV